MTTSVVIMSVKITSVVMMSVKIPSVVMMSAVITCVERAYVCRDDVWPDDGMCHDNVC